MASTGNAQTILIVLRGNSASGKSTVARLVREQYGRGVAIIGQDVVRREILWEKDEPSSVNIGMIGLMARHALDSGMHVIVEGILPVVHQYALDSGCGVLLVEQHIQLALETADRGYVLSHGQVVLHDRAELLQADRELLISSYLGEQQMAISDAATSSNESATS